MLTLRFNAWAGDELLCTAKMIRKITTIQITTMITSTRCRLTVICETSITQSRTREAGAGGVLTALVANA
jgi:hypothetical protein